MWHYEEYDELLVLICYLKCLNFAMTANNDGSSTLRTSIVWDVEW